MTRGNKICCFLILVLLAVSGHALFDPVKLFGFCIPAAYCFTAPLGGGTFTLEEGMAVVILENVRVLVPPSCSGMTFFLLAAFLFPVYGQWKYVLFGYPFSLFVNGIRILAVTGWTLHLESLFPYPAEFQHQLVGIAVFLTALAVLSVFLKLLRDRGREKQKK